MKKPIEAKATTAPPQSIPVAEPTPPEDPFLKHHPKLANVPQRRVSARLVNHTKPAEANAKK